MFGELEKKMVETEKTELMEDPESAVLEDFELSESVENMGAEESLSLTADESVLFQECESEGVQQLLEQYAMDDQEVLAALEIRSAATETQDETAVAGLRVEGGRSCGSAGGCSGSTWCYGCGDLR